MAGVFVGGGGGLSLMWWAWMWVRWAWPEEAMVLKRAMREGIDNCFFLLGKMDVPSKLVFLGMWNVVCAQAIAYSA